MGALTLRPARGRVAGRLRYWRDLAARGLDHRTRALLHFRRHVEDLPGSLAHGADRLRRLLLHAVFGCTRSSDQRGNTTAEHHTQCELGTGEQTSARDADHRNHWMPDRESQQLLEPRLRGGTRQTRRRGRRRRLGFGFGLLIQHWTARMHPPYRRDRARWQWRARKADSNALTVPRRSIVAIRSPR